MAQLTGVPANVFRKLMTKEPLTSEEVATVNATAPEFGDDGQVTIKTLRQRGLR